MKQKLLNSLKALPISQKDKESFIDTITELANNSGDGKINMSYFKYPIIGSTADFKDYFQYFL